MPSTTSIPIESVVYGIAMTDLEPLLKYLGEHHRVPAPDRPIPIPSQYKMDYNRLSDDARYRFTVGHPRLHLVDMYYQRTLDSTERDEVAEGFREAYREARARHCDDSDEILYDLEGYIVGNRRPTRKDEVAAWTVLAYFFGACDIFEVPPGDWVPTGGGT
ncbi:ABC-three component system protein [Yinghuangia sp. YIM S10712]|uniref:ABC-three component system protein n=1 Tax=Yinghuangia sp. YIM S10712 TaxID=3436930 RepID=UPI003F539EFA